VPHILAQSPGCRQNDSIDKVRTSTASKVSLLDTAADDVHGRQLVKIWAYPQISRIQIPIDAPIKSDLLAIRSEPTRETRRKNPKSPKIPLRPRTSMVDGG
jgi:hypothetical protein